MSRPTARAAAALAVAFAAPCGTAAAHIQVRPASAAPGDPVLWTVLVPSEAQAGTRQVELAIPKDVLPFSYADEPGWTRTVRPNPDGSVRSIVWRGRTRSDGLATFRFLASTPERDGAISWKAIQTYRDGAIVRWIGTAGSETPASITTISRSAPRENAGGEAAVHPAAAAGGNDGPDQVALAALAALVAALAAIVLRRRSRPA